MTQTIRSAKRSFPIWLLLLGLLLAIGAVVYWQRPSQRQVFNLSLTAGSEKGTRHQFAQLIAGESAQFDVKLTLTPTKGSEEAIERVDSGAIQLALVQGGLALGKYTNVRQVAALSIEPMHLLVRPELYENVARDLGELRGKTINLSTPGSGTFVLSLDILRFAGLLPGADRGIGDYTIHTMNYEQLLAADASQLPDAVFTVSSLPSPIVRALVQNHGYRLVSIPFAEALAVESQVQEMGEISPDQVRKRYITEATIPAYTYGARPPTPPQNLKTIGTRLLLIANKNVPDDAVKKLLTTLFETHLVSIPRPPLELSNLELPPETTPHPGMQAYLRDRRPMVTGELLEELEKTVTIAGGFLGVLIFAWQTIEWLNRKRWSRRMTAHIDAIAELRRKAVQLEAESSDTLPQLTEIRSRLDAIEDESFGDISEPGTSGDSLRDIFTSDLTETRSYLTALILRARDRDKVGV